MASLIARKIPNGSYDTKVLISIFKACYNKLRFQKTLSSAIFSRIVKKIPVPLGLGFHLCPPPLLVHHLLLQTQGADHHIHGLT